VTSTFISGRLAQALAATFRAFLDDSFAG